MGVCRRDCRADRALYDNHSLPATRRARGSTYLQGDGRADTVPGVSLYAGQSLNQWINPAAFTSAPNNIGRFGDSSIGSVVGPGETVVSLSLFKRISFNERVRMQMGAAAANALQSSKLRDTGQSWIWVRWARVSDRSAICRRPRAPDRDPFNSRGVSFLVS